MDNQLQVPPIIIEAYNKAIRTTLNSYTRQMWKAIELRDPELLFKLQWDKKYALKLVQRFSRSACIRTDYIRRFKA